MIAMGWELTASGHCADADGEADLIQRVSDAVAVDAAGCTAASLTTEHHGTLDLLGGAEDAAAEDEPEPEAETPA